MSRNTTAKIDLHGLTKEDAEIALRVFLDGLPDSIHTVEVIHGIGSGVLKEMVSGFYHSRIRDRIVCISNAGQTNYYIGKNEYR
jgi:DNA-nicking Smr family endonuclease